MSKKLALALAALVIAASSLLSAPPAHAAAAVVDGWTQLTSSPDTTTVYVSSSEGDDSNDGLTPQTPVRSLAWGQYLLRSSHADPAGAHPDHLLLKRGDVWEGAIASLASQAIMDAYNATAPVANLYSTTNQLRFLDGRSAEEPAVISYYGDSGARPVVKTSGNFIDHNGRNKGSQAIIGLHLIGPDLAGSGLSSSPEIRFVGSGTGFLIEDTVIEKMTVTVQAYNGTYSDVTIRRSVIADAYALGTDTSDSQRPSGLYVSGVDGITIEDNVFDHNGWNEDVPTAAANQYNHNIYMQTDNVGNNVVVRGNIIARASSHGIHGRSGGLFEDNLFVGNSVSLQLGYYDTALPQGTRATARNNVILAGKLMDPADTTDVWPRTLAVWGLNLDNLGDATVALQNNVVADRADSGSNVGISSVSAPNVTYQGNVQRNWGGGVGDAEDPSWPDPGRSVASYNATRGGDASLAAFLADARTRPLATWPEDLTAHAVNQYVRDGYGIAHEEPELPEIYVPAPTDPGEEPEGEVPPVADGLWFGNLGDGTDGGSDSSANYVGGTRFDAPADLTLTHLRLQVGAGAGAIKLGIYAADPATGEPGEFLGTTEERTDIPAGWNEFALASPIAVSEGSSYWFAIWSDWQNYPLIGDVVSGSGAERYMAYDYADEWPAAFLPDAWHPDLVYRIYAYSAATPPPAADPLPAVGDGLWLGSQSEGNTTDTSANYIGGSRFEAPANLTLSHLRIKVGAGSGAIKLGLYAADQAGEPAGFLGGTEERVDIPTGWNEFALTAPLTVTAGTSYWIVVWSDANNYPLFADWAEGSAAERYVFAPYGQQWPSVFTPDAYHPDLTLSLYAYGTPTPEPPKHPGKGHGKDKPGKGHGKDKPGTVKPGKGKPPSHWDLRYLKAHHGKSQPVKAAPKGHGKVAPKAPAKTSSKRR